MLWRTIRAYFLPSAHPELRPVRGRSGEELLPKRDEYGKRVDEEEQESVWDRYAADLQRRRNRDLVRPFMGLYIRRWGGLGGLLLLFGGLLHLLGLTVPAWLLFAGALGAFLMGFLLVLLCQEMDNQR